MGGSAPPAVNLTGLSPEQINAIAAQRLNYDVGRRNMGQLLHNINASSRAAALEQEKFGETKSVNQLNREKFEEEKRAKNVAELQKTAQLLQTKRYYDLQQKNYESLQEGRTTEARKYQDQMKLFEKYAGVTNPSQIPLVDQLRMFGKTFTKTGDSKDTLYMYKLSNGQEVPLTGNQIAIQSSKDVDDARQEKKDEVAFKAKIAEMNDVIEQNTDKPDITSQIDFVNEEGNNPFYWTKPIERNRHRWYWFDDDDVPAKKIPLPVAKNGHQLTMKDVRALAKRRGMSVDDYLRAQPMLQKYFEE